MSKHTSLNTRKNLNDISIEILERWHLKFKMKKLKDSYLIFLIPALILVILVQFLPMLYGLYLSVQNIVLNKPFVPVQFTWLSNYIELLSDSTFYYSIGVTFFIGIICVILQLIIGLLLALLLDTEVEKNKPVPGMGFFRGILFMPYMLMPIIVGIVWLVMYDQTYGLFNYFLTFFGVKPISWFANQNTAVWAIIIMDTWQCVPMIMLILSSGLKAIDYSFYEAAEIDGASIWQKFKYLTLPFLKPVILVAVAIRTMDVLRIYDSIYVTTRGGPGRVTEVMSVFAYNTAFQSMQTSKAAAASAIITLLILLVSFANIKILTHTEN